MKLHTNPLRKRHNTTLINKTNPHTCIHQVGGSSALKTKRGFRVLIIPSHRNSIRVFSNAELHN